MSGRLKFPRSARYGRRRIATMYADWLDMTRAMSEGDMVSAQDAFDRCQEWVDWCFGAASESREPTVFRPMPWHAVRKDPQDNPVEWEAVTLCGAVAYTIRRMRDGRFAWTRNTLHEPAVDTFDEAAALCDKDRRVRIISELAIQHDVELTKPANKD